MAKSKHYLDNHRFEEVIKLYIAEKNSQPNKYEAELIELLDILINTILDSFKFKLDRDDAMQDCYLLIFKKLRNFNEDNGSAFNYFTTVILNNLRLHYTKNKKYQEKIDKYIESKKDTFEG